MARSSTSPKGNITLSKESHAKLVSHLGKCIDSFGQIYQIRQRMKDIDKSYMRKGDKTQQQLRAAQANKDGDPTKFQNVVVPIVKPQVEAVVSNLSSIFLSTKPMFPVSATPEYMDAAMQMETILLDQEEQGGWRAALQDVFRDGAKYNLMAVEVSWDNLTLPTVKNAPNSLASPDEVEWSGNNIKRWDLYNSFWDLRCSPTKVHEDGEFAGVNQLFSRTKLLSFMHALGAVQNRKAALESRPSFTGATTPDAGHMHIPAVNPDALVNQDDVVSKTNWSVWFGTVANNAASNIQHADSYIVTTWYARIVPSDFGLSVPSPNTPAVWRFYVVNGSQIIFAEQLRNAHDYIPVVFGKPDEGGLDYQDESIAQDMGPYQALATAYANGGVAAMRRSIADRMLYDPSKIDKGDMDKPDAARIPVKAAHHGKPLAEAIYPIPFNDNISANAIGMVNQIDGFANKASGSNQVGQGQFVKGNKTDAQFAAVMNNSNSRNVNRAINIESKFLKPIKDILRLNILQFQSGTAVYNSETEQVVDVNPVILRQAVFKFKISDGLDPSSKVMSEEGFASALQYLTTSPQVAAEYNLGDALSYLFKQQKADISPFRKSPEQIAYEQAVNQWQSLALAMVEKGMDPSGLPQPVPANFGYDPTKPKTTVPASDPTGKSSIIQQVGQIMQSQSQANNPQSTPPNQGT